MCVSLLLLEEKRDVDGMHIILYQNLEVILIYYRLVGMFSHPPALSVRRLKKKELGGHDSQLHPLPLLRVFRRSQLLLQDAPAIVVPALFLGPDTSGQGDREAAVLLVRTAAWDIPKSAPSAAAGHHELRLRRHDEGAVRGVGVGGGGVVDGRTVGGGGGYEEGEKRYG